MLTAAELRGAFTALVTPFDPATLAVDETKLRELVDWQITSGVSGIVVAGTTGESATLSYPEHHRVVEIVVEEARKRVPVIAGAGSNNTAEAVELAEHARKTGADAILSLSPYYNKPTQDGLVMHYTKIAEVGMPTIIYNVPSRTGKNVEAATTLELAKNSNIIGIKEASNDLAQIQKICEGKPADFAVISGEDSQTLKIIEMGGQGVIGVILNEIPAEFSALVAAALAGDFGKAKELHEKYLPLMEANFLDGNPIDVKWALAEMGKLAYAVRLPLTTPSIKNQAKIKAVLTGLGLA
jgi:4-hydroxy-tetrahydrodipicolinate synthase